MTKRQVEATRTDRDRPVFEITEEMVEAGAEALWSEVDGDYLRIPESRCRDLARRVLSEASLAR